MSYRVELPVFSGPMDLLLHLVKQQEVDIHDVKITLVLDQYLAHIDVLEALDLADIGDFVVMASTLMEIKSRELLPREEVDLEQELNPKDDLIRRLLEYKRYRDISRRLAGMMERRGQMVAPVIAVPKELLNGATEGKDFDLGSIQVWDLTEAFAKLLEETGGDKEITFDVARRNVDYYAGQILDRMRGRANVNFLELFDPALGRYELIGVFSADTPRINPMFAMLLPSTLPVAIPGLPRRTDSIPTTSSGADVPNATSVSPTISLLMPSVSAIRVISAKPPGDRVSSKILLSIPVTV